MLVLKLRGLHCPNCAFKIENDARNMPHVDDAVLNLASETIRLNLDDFAVEAEIIDRIKKIVKSHEPGVVVLIDDSFDTVPSKRGFPFSKKLYLFALGIVLFFVGLVVDLNSVAKFVVFFSAYLLFGSSVIYKAALNILKGDFFDENFLMSIATIGAFVIGEYPEAVGVMLFYQIGEYLQSVAVDNSKKSIKSLMSLRPDYANLIKDTAIITVSPDTVNVDDVILVKPGEKVPLDGVVVEGTSQVDMSALTGESVPVVVSENDNILSGSINKLSTLKIKVTKLFGESTVLKILDLVENASAKKAPIENLITRFAKIYTPIVVFAACALAIIPPFFTGDLNFFMWTERALVFLVVSCPCALVISVPLAYFAGIGKASKSGILIKGGNYLQALNNADVIVFDKTGTLTKGVFDVTAIHTSGAYSKEDILYYAATCEKMSNHPIALSIQRAYEKNGKDIVVSDIKNFEEVEGLGVSANIKGKNILVGKIEHLKNKNIDIEYFDDLSSSVFVAIDNKFEGRIVISDVIKGDSASTIKRLKNIGFKQITMLTGDSHATASKVAKELNIDDFYSNLSPSDKLGFIEKYINDRSFEKVIFVGDGINDTPVLARADISFAMGGIGQDAAIEASDIVIMEDELSKICDAVLIAKTTNTIIWQNLTFAISVKFLVLILGAFGLVGMWMAVFADVGVTLMAILNSLSINKALTKK